LGDQPPSPLQALHPIHQPLAAADDAAAHARLAAVGRKRSRKSSLRRNDKYMNCPRYLHQRPVRRQETIPLPFVRPGATVHRSSTLCECQAAKLPAAMRTGRIGLRMTPFRYVCRPDSLIQTVKSPFMNTLLDK
jgi:hypothetical protein